MQTMNVNIRQNVIRELQSLPDDQLLSVLEYVRFLKIKRLSDQEIERNFISALKTARAISQQESITEKGIENEIAQVRTSQ